MKPIWCPGCGDFAVLSSLYKALSELNLPPEDVVCVSGIGCSGRTPEFLSTYGLHVVHGRVLPHALGVRLANPKLTVLGVGGDGDAFAIGAGHFPHAARRNPDVCYIVMDNEVYGLTKGQTSPTSKADFKTKSTPYGSSEPAINPIAMAIVHDATFVARGFSAQPQELTKLIVDGIQHKGFAFLQIMSPCVTFFDTYAAWKEIVHPLPEDWDASDKAKALNLALTEEVPHLGVFYRTERPTFEERATWASEKAMATQKGGLDGLIAEYA